MQRYNFSTRRNPINSRLVSTDLLRSPAYIKSLKIYYLYYNEGFCDKSVGTSSV